MKVDISTIPLQHVDRITASLAWKFGLDKDDLLQDLWLKLCTEFQTLRDPKRFKAWFYSIGINHCRNIYRHQKSEDSGHEKYSRETRGSTRRDGKPMLQFSSAPSPEEELIQKEQEVLRRKIVLKALESFPKNVVDAWLEGKPPKQIAEVTDTPLKTIYGMLKRMEKAIIREIENNPLD